MNKSFTHSMGVVQFVSDLLQNLDYGSQLTMTITAERSGDYSVSTAIDLSSVDTDETTVARFFSETQVNT